MAQDYKVGATFFPGLDDYYMPAETVDIVSPAPQRITPEVPAQMQNNLAALELEGHEVPRPVELPGESRPADRRRSSAVSPAEPSPAESAPRAIHFPPHPAQQAYKPVIPPVTIEEPNFSSFPKLQTRTANVPPTFEEREITLESARMAVLTSSDPEMQLYWAEDALAYVDNCIGYERHMVATDGATRPNTPPSERQIRTDAVNVVTFLAEQGHPKAEFMKGMWFEFGKFGQAQNKPEAFRAYKRAAAKGYARAEYRMGLQYESTSEPMKALQHYKAGEALADSASCYRVGMMCLMGQLGQTQDFVAGVRLVKFAADMADENAPQGAYVFGMLLAGELAQAKVPENFLPLDQAAARTYIEKAAFLGFAKAQVKMGAAYELCSLGCNFDPTLALHYMNLAARQGEPEAEMAISKWFLCGYEGLFKKNNELAFKYAQRAAIAGLDTAEFAMGYFNEVGLQTQVNISKAREWYEKASKNGNADATARLAALSASKPEPLQKSDHEQVALTRIRSQYGSRRGSRPEKLTKLSNPMPKIEDEPSSLAPIPATAAPRSNTPYPLEDRPVPVVERPVSSTPYPLDDMVARVRPKDSARGAFFVADNRPYSSLAAEQQRHHAATGGRAHTSPDNRPYPPQSSGPRPSQGATYGPAYTLPPGRQPQQAHYPPRGNNPPNRPMTTQPQPSNAQMQQRPVDPRMRLQQPSQSVPPPGRKPIPPKGNTDPPAHAPPADAKPTLPDIGFSAPVDPRADYKNRPVGTAGVVRPMMVEGRRPLTSGEAGARPALATRPPPAASTPPPQLSTHGHPPKKTFEELGVPSGKKDHDCIVM